MALCQILIFFIPLNLDSLFTKQKVCRCFEATLVSFDISIICRSRNIYRIILLKNRYNYNQELLTLWRVVHFEININKNGNILMIFPNLCFDNIIGKCMCNLNWTKRLVSSSNYIIIYTKQQWYLQRSIYEPTDWRNDDISYKYIYIYICNNALLLELLYYTHQ